MVAAQFISKMAAGAGRRARDRRRATNDFAAQPAAMEDDNMASALIYSCAAFDAKLHGKE